MWTKYNYTTTNGQWIKLVRPAVYSGINSLTLVYSTVDSGLTITYSIHYITPRKRTVYNLRKFTHGLTIPPVCSSLMRKNFIIRVLHWRSLIFLCLSILPLTNVYWQTFCIVCVLCVTVISYCVLTMIVIKKLLSTTKFHYLYQDKAMCPLPNVIKACNFRANIRTSGTAVCKSPNSQNSVISIFIHCDAF